MAAAVDGFVVALVQEATPAGPAVAVLVEVGEVDDRPNHS